MAKILTSPAKYIQGEGELSRLGQYAAAYGKKSLLLISSSGKTRIGAMLAAGFASVACDVTFALFGGECCKTEIRRLVALAKEQECDNIIGVGGGKILDTAKATAYYLGVPVIICPTIASTDAPCSGLSVIYTEAGTFEEYLFFPANPNVVLMDTAVIAKSPARLTISGMGDALATYFEAKATADAGGSNCAQGQPTSAALALAKLCLDTLLEEGLKCKLALEAGVCTPAVEKIIEANTLLSGLGFESGGLAAAHAIHNGLTVLPECHGMYHGEKVAFGTLVQLMLENRPLDEVKTIVHFCIELGLPVTAAQLGITALTEEKAFQVAEAACAPNDTMGNMPFPVTPKDVAAAIFAADAMGRYLLG